MDLTPLRARCGASRGHPDRVPACTRILRAAIADLEAVAVPVVDTNRTVTVNPASTGRTVRDAGPLSIVGIGRAPAGTGSSVQLPRRPQPQREAREAPLYAWTPATVAELLAAARVALRARGATGACWVSAHVNDASWRP